MINKVRGALPHACRDRGEPALNRGYVAKVNAFREDLIERAQGRDVTMPAVELTAGLKAWRRFRLLARRRLTMAASSRTARRGRFWSYRKASRSGGNRQAVTFLLDANVFLDFQNSGVLPELAQASHAVEMAVAEKVFDEVTLCKAGDSSTLVGKSSSIGSRSHVVESITAIVDYVDTCERFVIHAVEGPTRPGRARPASTRG